MNKSHIFSFAFLFTVLFIAGCQGGDSNSGGLGTFMGGVEGVSVQFVDLAPPKTFDEDDSVSVKVMLKNKGEFDLVSGSAKARIFGVNLDNFGLTREYKGTSGSLRGVGEFNTEGGQAEIDFGNALYALPVINSEDFTFRARVCYPYQTRILSDVCIASALALESNADIACDVAGDKIQTGDVSGAPIQVTSITEQTRGSNQVRFDLVIENNGKGEVFNPGVDCETLEADVSRLSNQDKVMLEIINPTGIVCDFKDKEPSSSGIVELKTGKATISCWMDVNDEPYVDRLSLKLDYLYRTDTSTPVRIFQKT